MNTTAIIFTCIIGAAMLAFLLYKNHKDGQEFRKQLMDDYDKTPDKEKDVDIPEESK